MTTEGKHHQNPWKEFHGSNLGYLHELYEQYRQNPDTVADEWKNLFQTWGAPPFAPETTEVEHEQSPKMVQTSAESPAMDKVIAAHKLAQNIRIYGHLAAEIDPLMEDEQKETRLIDPAAYGLSEADLKAMPANLVWTEAPDSVQDGLAAIERLRDVYTKSLAYEFTHVHNLEEQEWLNRRVESEEVNQDFSQEQRIELLRRLTKVDAFENFLDRTFKGQKRFSIEGIDVLVPMLDHIIHEGAQHGARNVMIGMAHRGRLNVLAHVLGKSYERIFSEFHHAPNKELVPSEGSMGINYGWTGDVKYHMGARREVKNGNEANVRLTLANNPSHLEFVNPVVNGFARAAQEERIHPGFPEQDVKNSFAIQIHGDAAFPGEGIVSETLNLSRLRGYQTGGTIHIIANNQLGFTTESSDARSTEYASDNAKGYEIPIVHVNADDPEACLSAIRLACEYRAKFHKDFLIDLIGYRRHGHNESDDPVATQPQLYRKIKNHPSVHTLYANQLQAKGLISAEDIAKMEEEVTAILKEAHERLKTAEAEEMEESQPPSTHIDVDTTVPEETLAQINADLLNFPEEHNVYPKLERILKRRTNAFEGEGKIDWPLAETLAFASILHDGTPIRLTGQDSERGTFAHRHLVLHDPDTGKSFSPLHVIPQAKASFAIHNSPLSEASVLGFEYGYNVYSPHTLVVWEAQFGDFANAGQVIIDQFLSAGRAKWNEKSSLVLLLPHGYEGQGPEHSSARLERFLQLSAENNWYVANVTSAAQYFHLLRRQAAISGTDEARPLIIMTPKSLLRHAKTVSTKAALSEQNFRPIVEQSGLGSQPDRVQRLLLCSGKIGVDLETALENQEAAPDWLHIVRVEQLYPFPKEKLKELIQRYPNLKEIMWVQEEPKNMGAWSYVEPRLRELASHNVEVYYEGRPMRSSTAEGQPDVHNDEQERIVKSALGHNDEV